MPTNTPLPTVTTGGVISAGTTNDATALNTCIGLLSHSSVLVGTAPPVNAPNFQVQGGTLTGTTTSGGAITLTFPSAFPNGLLTCVVMNGDITANPTLLVGSDYTGSVPTAGRIVLYCYNTGAGGPYVSGTVRLNWLAVGF